MNAKGLQLPHHFLVRAPTVISTFSPVSWIEYAERRVADKENETLFDGPSMASRFELASLYT